MVNGMLREVYVNGISPETVNSVHLRGYTSNAATTTTTAMRSGVKRDVESSYLQENRHYANKSLANKSLTRGTTAKWCSDP